MPQRREILLIDDEAPGRPPLPGVLDSRARDVEAALAAARARDFDAVLVAVGRADAMTLIARLTSPEAGAHIVIALTEEANPADAQNYIALGAVDWISRPEADAAALARTQRYARALRRARADAEAKALALARGDREKAMILSFIAHDLRNPFQVLLSCSRNLAETAGEDTDLARRAAGLHAAAAHAHGVLESLYVWARQARNLRVKPLEPFAADAMLQDSAALWRDRAESRGVRIEASASDLWIAAHEAAAAAILRNLVDNALKFTGDGGRVTLFAERLNGRVALCVRDTGVGMTPAQAADLFVGEPRSIEREGGLGLLLCRDLAEGLNGSLAVESRPGAGSTFRLWLPQAERPFSQTRPARRQPQPWAASPV